MAKLDRVEKFALSFAGIILGGILIFWITVGVVVIHFIVKLW